MKLVDIMNTQIKQLKDTKDVSDGYHTFGELYEHRITLFIVLCKQLHIERQRAIRTPGQMVRYDSVWRSQLHSDGTHYDGHFILGIGKDKGSQITYHLPMSKWDETSFAETLDKAPEFDGHTSEDVFNRLKQL